MIKELCDVMEKCYQRGWITTRDGNASFHRQGSKYIYITPSGQRKNVLRVEDIIKMTIQDGELVIPPGSNPSGELRMHWLLHKNSDRTMSIVHVHPTHVVAAMYAGWDLTLLAKEFPELGRYTTVAPTVPVLPVTSAALADATYERMAGVGFPPPPKGQFYDIVGQERHGVCAIARDPWSAYEHIERLDHICEIVLKSG
ncbi:MAG: class II aldolase/adducin family protein, partial [Nitrososphaerales archaeon]